MATFEDFMKLDIRVGTIIEASALEGVRKPAYKLKIDFGSEVGIKKSSAQITDLYKPEELIGKQIFGVVNLPQKQIASFKSEVLVLGAYNESGVILAIPDLKADNGNKLG